MYYLRAPSLSFGWFAVIGVNESNGSKHEPVMAFFFASIAHTFINLSPSRVYRVSCILATLFYAIAIYRISRFHMRFTINALLMNETPIN